MDNEVHVHEDRPSLPFCNNGNEQFLSQLCDEKQEQPDSNLLLNNSKILTSTFAVQFEKQQEELNQRIKFQSQQLRSVVHEKEKEHVEALLKDVESHSLDLLKKKDQEILQAINKTWDLEDFLKRLEVENVELKRVAQENEDIAFALYKTLEEEKKKEIIVMADDAESCCGTNKVKEEVIMKNEFTVCKSCDSHRPCILFLPCRHLASCQACANFLEACPRCGMPKKASIEALIF